jgi:hypothetical protein
MGTEADGSDAPDARKVDAWPSAEDRLLASAMSLNENEHNLKDHETQIRLRMKQQSPILLFLLNAIATIAIVMFHLISLESLFSIALSISMTVYVYLEIKDESDFKGDSMNWILLTFAIVTPMSASIGMAFARREKALTYIAALRSLFFSLYQAHASWDWGTSVPTGRAQSKVNWLQHSDAVLRDISQIGDDLTRYLTMPSTSRARHRVIPQDRQYAKEGREIGDQLMEAILTRVNRISLYCEILKLEGLPGNEAARIRQWEREIVLQIETLQVIKEYRTPQALRSLCRLFSVLLPPYYAPFYAQMAVDLKSLPMAIAFSILTSLALTALFESLTQMEDPFVAHLTLDGIDVPRELQQLQNKRLLSQRNTVFFSDVNVSVEGLVNRRQSPDSNLHPRIFGE